MIRIPGRWWSKLMNWMMKRAPRGKAMVLRPNPAKQASVSQQSEIEEDPRWSEDYTSVESRLAVSLRSERGGSVSHFWFNGLISVQLRNLRDSKNRQGKPRPADCRLRMRGFGDDCDSSTGLVVLSHRPTLLKERDT
ncbi:hypothetical protein QBC32DRAFT_396917 [Pseudoneurospora amorphoporcata]|uniref:Uncharacterized protein n=1 Tax=Pseudoneurospora amorphoporcata TaxID=241081 RepID=A0AAN6NZ08_9PEZI|nr:hypothetical protein QBC32DRAFT_396917 [Pseudoneurospora amorphoporcata]